MFAIRYSNAITQALCGLDIGDPDILNTLSVAKFCSLDLNRLRSQPTKTMLYIAPFCRALVQVSKKCDHERVYSVNKRLRQRTDISDAGYLLRGVVYSCPHIPLT